MAATQDRLRAVAACAIGCVVLLTGPAAVAADGSPTEPAKAAPTRWIADVNFGFFTGDYGTDEQTDVEILSPRLRRRFSRGELRASFPQLRVSSAGNVTFVGGNPVAATRASGDGTTEAAVETVRIDDSVEGPGDVRLHGELDILRGGGSRPWLTGIVQLKLPTADEAEGLGTGKTDVAGGLALMQTFGRTSLLADARYTAVGDPDDYTMNDVASLGAGVSQKIGERRGSYLFAYVENRTHPTPGESDRLDLSLGGSRRFGETNRVRLAGAAYVGLTESAEDFGLSMTLGRAF